MLHFMKGIDFLASREIVIVSGARTPFGAYLGSLSGMTATELAVHASVEAIARAKIDPKEIDQAISEMSCNPVLMQHISLVT